MMGKYTVTSIVSDILEDVNFNTVSDLTKEQFIEILSTSIYKSITSDYFIDHIDEALAKRLSVY
ncbi:hypothetical protein [Clostridium perfringens]|uniref:hypothetical protein n=1 Tax=Clostridium perfringens TaxID=1502 RepID=UPI0008A6AFD4|nr:hypothetical protein [Clostridium perfringens]AOY53664.1 hypothetical protein FORC25_1248 [Clostridium perfringens]EJT5934016.1 hypothetical protein [Clostridium perfringens]ELC8347505.1 hypothetical protein [Clostridium perfringens]TBX12801.1 hypothetical protein BFS03_06050 [Clostridium perfringens]HBI7336925.1 hypothetical protein [Clostridium perfringens]